MPKALVREVLAELGEDGDESFGQTPEEFAREMFGDAGISQSEEHGLPTLGWLKENYKTKSAAIRYLVHEGFQIKHIAKHLGIKYQHARNVATQTLKRGPNEDWRPKEQRLDPNWKATNAPTTKEGE